MKFENTKVFGFEEALRGMRNPKESWAKSDSEYKTRICELKNLEGKVIMKLPDEEYYNIGPNDIKLAQNLISAGSEHRKFMRQIFVSVDITAPLYW